MADLNNIYDSTPFLKEEEEDRQAPIIKVIGVGGGGGNAVNYLYSKGIENITYLVCNTDKQALRELSVPNRIVLGDPSAPDYGLGAGDSPAKGKISAEFSEADIAEALNDQTCMVFITAGMGGGTGTGAGPVIARLAKQAGKLTIGIVTIPFFFEGEHKILKALEGAEEMRKHVDSLLIINNQRLTEIYKDLNLINAFSKADDTLANATSSIAHIIHTRGYINVDFNDVKTTLEESSTSIISTGYGEGEHRVSKAIEDALDSPLLRNSDIKTSKRLLFYLYCSPKAENVVSMEEMSEITQFSARLSKNIRIKWGACWDESLGEAVKMTILASGFDITINNADNTAEDTITFKADTGDNKTISSKSTSNSSREDISKIIDTEYGEGKLTEHNQDMARAKYVVLKPSQFDDDEVIALFDKIPTYTRKTAMTDKIRRIGTVAEKASTASADSKAKPKTSTTDTSKTNSDSTQIVF